MSSALVAAAGGDAPADLPRDAQGRARVAINTSDPRAVIDVAVNVGGTVLAASDTSVDAVVPAERLLEVASAPGVRSVLEPLPVRPAAAAPSEGVRNAGPGQLGATNAQAWQAAARGGAGVKVGVVDVGFGGYAAAQAAGDLPANVTTQDYCSGNLASPLQQHGTAVAEIVHQMAPDAQLYLVCITYGSDFWLAEQYLLAQGVKLVNASLTLIGETRGDGADPISSMSPDAALHDAWLKGQLWTVAAGNEGGNHYGWVPSGTHQQAGATSVELSPGVFLQSATVPAGGTVDVSLVWDEWRPASSNFDLYVYPSQTSYPHAPAAWSTNVQNGSPASRPWESTRVTNTTSSARTYYIEVRSARSNNVLSHRFDLYVDGSVSALWPMNATGSVTFPGTSPYALTVGAHCWRDGSLAFYSGQGPTVDGRRKPDVTGPTAVSSPVYGVNTGGCSSGFNGTSSAAPHVTGAAALLSGYLGDIGPGPLYTQLTMRSVETGGVGPDTLMGFGRLDVGTLLSFPGAHDPVAALDAPLGGGAKVTGSALDPDTASPVTVQLVVDGVGVASMVANGNRPDIAAAWPDYTAAHGFSFSPALGPGAHTICVVVYNAGPGVDRNGACERVAPDAASDVGALRFVDGVYRDVLQRHADTGGASYWYALVTSGVNRSELSNALLRLPEYSNLLVTQSYQWILRRNPDAGGLQYWSAYHQQGGEPNDLRALLYGSPEYLSRLNAYYSDLSSFDNRSYVIALYRDVLAREPDGSGLAYWQALLAKGTSRVSVAQSFVTLPEPRGHLIAAYYAQLLGRPPGGSEITYWLSVWSPRGGEDIMISGLLGSPEFSTQAGWR